MASLASLPCAPATVIHDVDDEDDLKINEMERDLDEDGNEVDEQENEDEEVCIFVLSVIYIFDHARNSCVVFTLAKI